MEGHNLNRQNKSIRGYPSTYGSPGSAEGYGERLSRPVELERPVRLMEDDPSGAERSRLEDSRRARLRVKGPYGSPDDSLPEELRRDREHTDSNLKDSSVERDNWLGWAAIIVPGLTARFAATSLLIPLQGPESGVKSKGREEETECEDSADAGRDEG